MRQRIQDGYFHGGDAHLRQHTAIDELDERVNDALRMYDDIDSLVGKTEEEVRLDYFERLVGECRAIDGDLSPHPPRRMTQRILDCR